MRWAALLIFVGCSGDGTASDAPSVFASLDGSWSGTARDPSSSYAFAADFLYDESSGSLTGQANVYQSLFDLQDASESGAFADLELLDSQGRSHLELQSVEVVEPDMDGHFVLDLCWETDPNSTNPSCRSEGNFTAKRQ